MVDTLTNPPRSTTPNKDLRKKFLFDVNIFDEPAEEIIPETPPPPPPPTFSEKELEAAKSMAFEKGRQQGVQESLQSREHHLVALVDKISQDMSSLFASELGREKRYEAEAIALTLATFEKLFPLYAAHKGFDELKAVMTDILRHQEGQAEILVEIAPSQKEGVAGHIGKIQGFSGKTAFQITENESLQEGQCKLSWTHGGALYNSGAIAEEIRRILEEALAVNSTNGHDKGGEASSPSNISANIPVSTPETIDTETEDKGQQE